MFAVAAEGLDGALARLDALPAALISALAARASDLAAELVDRVKYDKLAGGALNTRSGALQDSIVANVSPTEDGFVASVASEGDVKYAAIQEYGGQTGAHDILPSKAQALAFVIGGTLRFAKSVHHPGSTIPARSYLGSALDEMSDDLVAALAGAANMDMRA